MIARALLALLLCAGAAQAEDKPDCRLKIIAGLEMQTTMDGRVTVPVQIEGHDYRLLVDTGGFIDTLSPEVIKREGYKIATSYGVQLRGMGTTMLTDYVTVNDTAIGRSHGHNFKFFVEDQNSLFWDGTLAPEILATYDTDLDFGHDKLNLISPDHCPGKVAYWTRSPVGEVPISMEGVTHISAAVTVDGKDIDAILDTGADTSYITLRTAARLLGLEEDDPAFKLRGNQRINGMSAPVYSYPFKSLSFGAITVNNPNIEIVSDKVWGEKKLLLGVSILRQLHLYIAYKEHKLYVSPAMAN